MIDKVEKYIKKEGLVKSNDSVILAISGGPDSVAMLDIMANLAKKMALKIVLAHFNHQIRVESNKDQYLVENLAEKYGLELELGRAKKELKSEEEARDARYGYFSSVAEKRNIKLIALAQNKSDQLETVLFNFIRGAGAAGLAGIRPSRPLKNSYYLIRPILCLSREEVVDYLNKNNIKFIVDRTNLSLDYTRNRLRHQIIPALKELNPSLEEGVFNQAEIFWMIESYLTSQANMFLAGKANKNKAKIEFKQKDYLKLEPIIQFQVIRQSTDFLANLKNIGYVHLKEINKIFNQESVSRKYKAFKGLKFVKQTGRIRIVKIRNN